METLHIFKYFSDLLGIQYPPVLSAMIVGNCSEMETWLHFYFYCNALFML